MANGFVGSKESWDRLTAPLLGLDSTLEAFANQHGMSLKCNHHNWPSRSLEWGAPVERLIQIYLADEEPLTWNFWLCAHEDRPAGRYWKRQFLRESTPIEDIADSLTSLLVQSHQLLESWSADDLVLGVPGK